MLPCIISWDWFGTAHVTLCGYILRICSVAFGTDALYTQYTKGCCQWGPLQAVHHARQCFTSYATHMYVAASAACAAGFAPKRDNAACTACHHSPSAWSLSACLGACCVAMLALTMIWGICSAVDRLGTILVLQLSIPMYMCRLSLCCAR